MVLSGLVLIPSETPYANITRDPGEELRIENETLVLNKNEEFQSITIDDNSTLIIRRARITVQKIYCDGDSVNTAFIVEQNSLVAVQDGELNVNADKISITGDSTITLIKGFSAPIENATRGGDSYMNLVSRSNDLTISNSEIKCQAQSGSKGTSSLYGGSGGKARTNIIAEGDNGVVINDSIIRSLGGAGGDNFAGSGAGAGGDSVFNIEGSYLDVSESLIESKGGQAGASTSLGADGGKSEFTLNSDEDITIQKSDILSTEGMSSEDETKQQSRLRITSDEGSILVDHYKSEEEKKDSLSTIQSAITTLDSPVDTKLHQVDVGESQPQKVKTDSAEIEILWWAEIEVEDNYGNPLENAVITYTKSEDPTTYPADPDTIWLTDENGRIDLEVVGRESSRWVNYFFTATEAEGGASQTSDRISFKNNQNEMVPIEITLMTVALTSVMGEDYTTSMPIAGNIVFIGSAIPGNPNSDIESVKLYKGEGQDRVELGDAEDISGEGDPYSEWRYEWDAEGEPEGPVNITVEAVDPNYEISVVFRFTINELAVNHEPIIETVKIEDSRGETKEVTSGDIEVFVTLENPNLVITGTILEEDYVSQMLDIGRALSEASMTIVLDGEEIYNRKVLSSDDELIRIDEQGRYSYEFGVDTGNYKGTNEPWPEGDYRVSIQAWDDVPRSSEIRTFNMTLGQDFYPYIELFVTNNRLRDDKYGEDSVPSMADPDFIEPTFTFKTMDSHTRTIRFDFSKMNDYDSPGYQERESYKYLEVAITITKPRGGTDRAFGPEKGASGFNYTFDVENIDEGEDGVFTMNVIVVDEDGLESEKVFKVRVYHYPPPPDPSIPLLPDVNYGSVIYAFPSVFILVLVAYLGLVIGNTTVHKRGQKKKKALIEKMRKEKKKKESSVIDDEFTRGVTSKTYMERTGSEGDEDFSKQLESASKQPQQKPQPPKQETTPPTTPPKQTPQQKEPVKGGVKGGNIPAQKPPSPPKQAVQQSEQAPGGPPTPPKPPAPPKKPQGQQNK